jgi:hypothetical protein
MPDATRLLLSMNLCFRYRSTAFVRCCRVPPYTVDNRTLLTRVIETTLPCLAGLLLL